MRVLGKLLLVVLVVPVLFMVGCDNGYENGGGTPPPPPPGYVTSLVAPTNLRLEGAGENRRLVWNAVAGADFYEVRMFDPMGYGASETNSFYLSDFTTPPTAVAEFRVRAVTHNTPNNQRLDGAWSVWVEL